MNNLRQTLVGLVGLAIVVFLISILFVSALYAFAIFAPLLGIAYLASRLAAASQLWRSGGHFQLGEAVRIIGAGRARVLAILAVGEGAAGMLLSAVPALIAFDLRRGGAPIIVGVTAVAAFIAMRTAKNRVLRDAHPVDVLPPPR